MERGGFGHSVSVFVTLDKTVEMWNTETMTLHTKVLIGKDGLTYEDVFNFAKTELLGRPDYLYVDKVDWNDRKGLFGQPAQGADAWLDAYDVNGWVQVGFDTAYGYKAENGAGCSDLHAWYIYELVRKYSDNKTTIMWYNEFEGTWHDIDAEYMEEELEAGDWGLRKLGDPSKGQQPGLGEQLDREEQRAR